MKIFKTGALCAALLFALSGSAAAESTVVKIPQKMDNGEQSRFIIAKDNR